MKKNILTLLLCLTSSVLHTNNKALPTHTTGFCALIAAATITEEETSKKTFYLDTMKKPIEESKLFSCLKCGFLAHSKKEYSSHNKWHTQQKNSQSPYSIKKYECPECQKMFPSPSKLARHLTVHTEEHPFKCGICGAKFTQKPSAKSHIEKLHKDCGLPLTESIIGSLIILKM